MHELALAAAIRDTALRHAEGQPVSAVRVRVGEMRQVVPGPLRFYFGAVSDGTGCAGATLELELVPARLRCQACGYGWRLAEPSFRCPSCGAAEFDADAGEELEIESIDVEGSTDA
jgi:hydrogenase nickel incorporation protein HypA/HybF